MTDAVSLRRGPNASHRTRGLIEEARSWLLARAAVFRHQPALPATLLRPRRSPNETGETAEMPAEWLDLDVSALAEGLLELGRDGFVRRCPEL